MGIVTLGIWLQLSVELISHEVDHFLKGLVFNISNGPECFSSLRDTVKQIALKFYNVSRGVSGNSYPHEPFYFIAVSEYLLQSSPSRVILAAGNR